LKKTDKIQIAVSFIYFIKYRHKQLEYVKM